jgi:hypothetical protein
MSLVQRYAEWREGRLIRKHNSLKQEDSFAWGLTEVGLSLEEAAHDPARALSDYVHEQLSRSDEFYAVPEQVDYALTGAHLTFPSSVEVDALPSQTVHARVFPGTRLDHGVVIVPHWNARGEAYDALGWLINRLFDIHVVRIALPGHDWRAAAPGATAGELCSANIGRTLRGVRQAAVDVKAAARWLHAIRGCSSVGLVGASLGSCVGTLAMAHEPLIESGCFIHSCASFGEAVWTGAATQHVRRAVEPHISLQQLAGYWELISPATFVPKLASRRSSTTIISARNDAVFIPELTARLRLIYRRAGVPLEQVVLPCGHYSIGSFPFGVAALEAVLHHLREWTGLRPAARSLGVLHAARPLLGLRQLHA